MAAPEPKIKRSFALELKGDLGGGDLHRIAGWLSREIAERSGPFTRIGIWNGRGHVDNLRAVGRGQVDIALVTPASFARMAVAGGGPYTREAYPDLLAIGQIPSPDRLLFAVSAGTGVRTFKDLREDRPPLRIATAPNDGIHHVGMAVANVLERSGVSRQAIEGWGGRFIEHDDARACTEAVLNGDADAVFHAGAADPSWPRASMAISATCCSSAARTSPRTSRISPPGVWWRRATATSSMRSASRPPCCHSINGRARITRASGR